MELKQGVTQIFPATVRIPCDIWGCRSGHMASHFIGRPENPKNVLTNICPVCLDELKESIYEQFGAPAAAEPEDAEPVDIVSQINATEDAIVIEAGEINLLPFEPEAPEQPDTEEVLEIDGKLITEYTVPELKVIAKDEGLSGYSDKNKDELIALLTAHFEKSEE